MFRIKNLSTPIMSANKNFAMVVDTFDSQSFNLNDCGWIRNDIAQLARATSKSQYDAIAARLVEMAGKGDVTPDMSIEDAISMIKPRYAQSPTEIAEYLEMTNSVVMKNVDAAYQKAINSGQIKTPEPAPSDVTSKSLEVTD